MIDALDAVVAQPRIRVSRRHHVTAVLVSHDGARWLPRVLASLAELSTRPDCIVAVDTGSVDNSADQLRASESIDEVVVLDRGTSLGEAIGGGLAAADATVDISDGTDTIDLRTDSIAAETPLTAPGELTEWVWILHDDCAVTPEVLWALLNAADDSPEAAIVGPKTRGWRHPDVILERGISVTPSGRLESGVERDEVDQGQYDDTSEVFAVGSAAMLIRRDLWDRLGGFSPTLPLYRADVDFCWRARRAGAEVIWAPHAVVHHRQSSRTEQRSTDAVRGSRRYAHRRAAVLTGLAHAPLWRLPFRAVRVFVAALVRLFVDLVSLAPGRAWDNLRGSLVALLSWRQLRRSRAQIRSIATVHRRELTHLRPTVAQRALHWQESVATLGAGPGQRAVPQRISSWLSALLMVGVPLFLACLAANPDLWFGPGQVFGGALLPAPDSAVDLLTSFLSPWHEVGLGSDVGMPPYVAVLAGFAIIFLGSATTAVQVLGLAAPVFAGLSALVALRGVVARPIAITAAVAYGLLPATIAATGTGRLGTAAAAVVLPAAIRVLARLVGLLEYRGFTSVALAVVATAALAAFVPALALALATSFLLIALAKRRGRAMVRVLGTTALAFLVVWPWSGYLIENAGLLLLEVGAQPASLTEGLSQPYSLLLLDPGGPATPLAGLAVLITVLGILALVPSSSRPGALFAWVLVVIGLVLGSVQLVTDVAVPWAAPPVQPWPGPATLLMGAGLILAACLAFGSANHRSRSRGRTLFLVATAVTPLILAGWWVFGQNSLLQRSVPGSASAFVTAEANGPGAPRAVVISGGVEGVRYELLSGAGLRLGDADVAPPADTMTRVDEAVSRLITGGSPEALQTLAGISVQYVAADVRADRELARRLDAVVGLRRVSTVAGQALWTIENWSPRVRAVDAAGEQTLIPVSGTDPITVSATLPDGTERLELAESASPLWSAEVDGAALTAAPADDSGLQTFTVGSAGDLSVTSDPQPRRGALLGSVVVIGLVALGAGLSRRRRSPGGVR